MKNWAKKAYREAKRYGENHVAASLEGNNFSYIQLAVIWKFLRIQIMFICVKIIAKYGYPQDWRGKNKRRKM